MIRNIVVICSIQVVSEALYQAGPTMFHQLAEKVQLLPRHLLMAWLEVVFLQPGSSMGEGRWDSEPF